MRYKSSRWDNIVNLNNCLNIWAMASSEKLLGSSCTYIHSIHSFWFSRRSCGIALSWPPARCRQPRPVRRPGHSSSSGIWETWNPSSWRIFTSQLSPTGNSEQDPLDTRNVESIILENIHLSALSNTNVTNVVMFWWDLTFIFTNVVLVLVRLNFLFSQMSSLFWWGLSFYFHKCRPCFGET